MRICKQASPLNRHFATAESKYLLVVNMLMTCLHRTCPLRADDGSSLVLRTIDIPLAAASYLETSSNAQTLNTASVRCMYVMEAVLIGSSSEIM